MAMLQPIWWYRSKLVRVVDGDTYYMLIDLGFRTRGEHSIRLWGLDTPELRGTEEEKVRGRAAKQFVIDWFKTHRHPETEGNQPWPFKLHTQKDKTSFNRYIGEIYCAAWGHDLRYDLQQAGHEK